MTLKKLSATAIIMNSTGKVLLVKHSYGHMAWELPGGDAEANETVEGTACREVLEETGLRVVAERMVGVYYDVGSDMHQVVFVCRPLDGGASPKPDRGEITDCAYWSIDELPNPISDFTIRRIKDAMSEMPTPSLTLIPSPTYSLSRPGSKDVFPRSVRDRNPDAGSHPSSDERKTARGTDGVSGY